MLEDKKSSWSIELQILDHNSYQIHFIVKEYYCNDKYVLTFSKKGKNIAILNISERA